MVALPQFQKWDVTRLRREIVHEMDSRPLCDLLKLRNWPVFAFRGFRGSRRRRALHHALPMSSLRGCERSGREENCN
jgi:hypothetical protein